MRAASGAAASAQRSACTWTACPAGRVTGAKRAQHESRGLTSHLGGISKLRFAEFVRVQHTAREAVKRVARRVQRARAAVWVGGVVKHLDRSQKARAEGAAHSHGRAQRHG